MRSIWLLLLLAACETATSEPAKRAPVETRVERAAPARHEVMARKVIAAIAADDVDQLRALSSPDILAELGDMFPRDMHRLREKLDDAKIDLAKAKIVRVERSGDNIETVDVFLEHEGKTFNTHFNVMTIGGRYHFMGHAVWFAWKSPGGATP